MTFLQRLASGLKDVLGLGDSDKGQGRSLGTKSKSMERQRSKRCSSASYNFLEQHTREAIATFVQDKHDKGLCKPHVFNQFWLQFSKLEAGFEVVRAKLQEHTGSQDGPIPVSMLQDPAVAASFGIAPDSPFVASLAAQCEKHRDKDKDRDRAERAPGGGAPPGACDLDFVGLAMVLLVSHLTEPGCADTLHPQVRTALQCMELAFTHFNSARHGRLDKREVAEALQYESAKAHHKEGRQGRTSNRLAHKLFEGLDWEHDNTISFENFLRGILQLVREEFGEEDEDGEAGAGPGRASSHHASQRGSAANLASSSAPPPGVLGSASSAPVAGGGGSGAAAAALLPTSGSAAPAVAAQAPTGA